MNIEHDELRAETFDGAKVKMRFPSVASHSAHVAAAALRGQQRPTVRHESRGSALSFRISVLN